MPPFEKDLGGGASLGGQGIGCGLCLQAWMAAPPPKPGGIVGPPRWEKLHVRRPRTLQIETRGMNIDEKSGALHERACSVGSCRRPQAFSRDTLGIELCLSRRCAYLLMRF